MGILAALQNSGVVARLGSAYPAMIALLLLGTTIYVLTTSVIAWRRLRHIPGPTGAAWSRWWLLRNTLGGEMHLALKQACEQYGHLARIGPNLLVTDDADVIRRMWAVRSPYLKSDWYDAIRWDPSKDNLISQRDDRLHNELRAKMAAGYSGKDNDSLEATMDADIAAFIELLERKYLSTRDGAVFRPVDMARKVQYLTLDVISSVAFGKNFGHIRQDRDVFRYIETTEKNMPLMLVLSLFPSLARATRSPFLRGLMPSEKDRLGFGPFIAVAKQVVNDRLASANPFRKDMLGSFLTHGLTRVEAEGETLTQVIAGSDTTATALRMALFFLASASPSAYTRLAAEVRGADAAGALSRPAVADAEARALPYLQAVVRETLRVFPPVVGLMPTVVPPGGDVLCGDCRVPAGTQVGVSFVALQHNRAVFGADAACFRPERWLEAGPDRLKAMTATWELVFKYGKWQCLGKQVALIEMNKVLVELFRRFDFSLVNPMKAPSSYSAGIFVQEDLWFRITRTAELEAAEAGKPRKNKKAEKLEPSEKSDEEATQTE